MHENELPFINGGEHIEWVPDIDTVTSLLVIVAAMAVAVIASLIKLRIENRYLPTALTSPGDDEEAEPAVSRATSAPAPAEQGDTSQP
jgi:tellurite resistance protein TerC